MRKLFIVSAVFFAFLAIVFTILPLGTIAILPIALTVVLSFMGVYTSKGIQNKLPKLILIISVITFLFVIGKVIFIQDKVQIDKQFEQQKIESKKEDVKDLEGL